MAVTYSYNDLYTNCTYIYRATGGGVTFSSNLVGTTFDYFTDTAVTNDAVYFASIPYAVSNLKVNVGTPISGTGVTGVWEYFCTAPLSAWRAMHAITDPTSGLTVAGSSTIVFPIQAGMYTGTVNGIAGYAFVRYRITGGTVSEGGANQTSIPSMSDGRLVVTGGTDSVPGSFGGIYNWLVSNVPEVSVFNPAPSVYKFDNVRLTFSSVVKSTKEQIFIGNGSYLAVDFSYLVSGIKVGTDGWKDPSYFFFCINAGGNIMSTSQNYTKIYGGVWGGYSCKQDGVTFGFGSYFGNGNGEYIGLTVDWRGGYFAAINSDKCTHWGEIISTSFPSNYPTNMRISNPSTYILGIYNGGGTVTGLNYALPTSCVFMFNQGGGGNYSIYFRDPSPALPSQATAPRAVAMAAAALTSSMLNVFYYDVSTSGFTDYTTQANDSTSGDVPLIGDVGDIYYFRYATSNAYQTPLNFTITNQSNDYEYVWEYYYSNSWRSMVKTWDLTESFTKSGVIWNAHLQSQLVTINSVNGYWYRLRVTSKGILNPVCSRVQSGFWTGVGDWRIYEQMSVSYSVTGEDASPIDGALVRFTDANSTVVDLTTSGSGGIPKTYLTTSTFMFDPVNGDSTYKVLKVSANPFMVEISKDGFESYREILTLSAPVIKTVTLKEQVAKIEDDVGNIFDRVDKTNSGGLSLRRKIVRN